jgi:hypothetical protein
LQKTRCRNTPATFHCLSVQVPALRPCSSLLLPVFGSMEVCSLSHVKSVDSVPYMHGHHMATGPASATLPYLTCLFSPACTFPCYRSWLCVLWAASCACPPPLHTSTNPSSRPA